MTVETATHPPLSQIQPQTLRHTVRMEIEGAIVQGLFRGGEKLNEAQLCRALGVSRGSVREALRDLEASGVLVSIPYRGTFVKEWTPRSVQELYTLRSSLEEFGIQLAVQNASDADLEQLEQLVQDMCSVAHNNDEEAMVDLDLKFHQRLHELSGHRLLETILRGLAGQTRMFIVATKTFFSPFSTLEEAAASHHPILTALRARDPQMARSAMRKHIADVGEIYVRQLQAAQATGD